MALVLNDRVKETTTTTGTGAVSLGGAATGFETFAQGIGNSNTTYYAIIHESADEWEVGLGTLDGDSSDLTRTTVLTSSNSDSAVNFSSGNKTVICTLPASKAVFLDADGDVTLGANLDIGGNLVVTGTTTFNGGTLTLGDANTDNIVFGGEVDSNIIPDDDDTYDLGSSTKQWQDLFIDGTANIDSLVADTADINGGTIDGAIIGGASAAAITGTAITGTSFVIGSADINETELETIDGVTAGTVAASKAVVVDANKDVSSFRNVTATTFVGNIDAVDGDFDGTLETDALSINGTAVTSTAAELNALDGITAVVGELNALDLGSTAVGTAIASKAVILDSNKDYTGIRNLTITGELDGATLDLSGDADIAGTTNLDNTDIDGTLVVDGSNISLDSTSTLNIDNSNTSNGVTIGTATSGVPISIGHSTSEVTINDNLTVTGNFTVSGTSTTVDSTTVAVADSMFKLAKDQGTSADALDFGFYGQYGVGGTAKYAGVFRDVSATGDPFTFFDTLQAEPGTTVNTSGTGYDLADIAAGGATFADNVTITGDADVDGTLEADAITVNGTALNTVIAGVTVTNATTAAVATTVTISDNESTNEDNAIIFTAGGDVDGGNIGLESDGDLIYNPSTGRLTATQLAGTLQTAAQANITSLGTLTTLTVDNVIINGSTIGHTGDTDLMTVASGVLTVAGEVSMTTLDIGGTNVTSTAAELNIMDGGTSATGTTLADADRVVVNDNGTMKQVAMTDISTYTDGGATALAIALG
jgi:hypothetical protein